MPQHRFWSHHITLAACGLMAVVGLGSFAGATDLTISDDTPELFFDDTLAPLYFWRIFPDDLAFDIIDDSAGTTPLRIEPGTPSFSFYLASSGWTGLGTTAPLRHLHVSTADLDPTLRLESIDGQFPSTWDLRGTAGGFDLLDVNNNSAAPFGVQAGAPTDTMYLTSTGSVGIGTATPDTNSRVDIRSSLTNGLLMKRPDANAHYLRVETTAGIFRSGVQGNGDAQFGALTAGKGLNLLAGGASKIAVNSTGQISFGNVPPAITTRALIHQSGAHLTLAGVWTNASSRALKQDIEPITSEQARDTVRALQPVGYRYKSEPAERYVGFIAEDVPDLVATNDRQGLAPMDITAVLTKVVQDQDRLNDQQQQIIEQQQKSLDEQRRLIAEQQQALAALTRRLTALEQRGGATKDVTP